MPSRSSLLIQTDGASKAKLRRRARLCRRRQAPRTVSRRFLLQSRFPLRLQPELDGLARYAQRLAISALTHSSADIFTQSASMNLPFRLMARTSISSAFTDLDRNSIRAVLARAITQSSASATVDG